jgi:hypothetical protein
MKTQSKTPLFYPPLSERAKIILNLIALLVLFTIFNIGFIIKYPTAFRYEKSPAMISREINDAVHIEQEYGAYVVHEDFTGQSATFDNKADAEQFRSDYLASVAQEIFDMRHAHELDAARNAREASNTAH